MQREHSSTEPTLQRNFIRYHKYIYGENFLATPLGYTMTKFIYYRGTTMATNDPGTTTSAIYIFERILYRRAPLRP